MRGDELVSSTRAMGQLSEHEHWTKVLSVELMGAVTSLDRGP